MSGKKLTTAQRQQVLALLAAGHTVREVGGLIPCSNGTVQNVAKAAMNTDSAVALTPAMRDSLGEDLVRWAEVNAEAVNEMKDRMRDSGSWDRVQGKTAVLLALAERVHAELAQQTGGVHPTMRSALYRMMGVYGAAKKLYGSLGKSTTLARKAGVFDRDFWAESDPLTNRYPGWWTPERALRGRLLPLARPHLTLRGTGYVIGVIVEAAGQASGLEGAIEQRLGYELPVWPLGGVGSLPRIDYVSDQMLGWADQNDALNAVLFVITDFDPSGLVIANAIAENVSSAVEVVRLGMNPDLAGAHGAVAASATGESFDEDNTHAQSAVWQDACDEFGIADPFDKDECFQAEALDYETWADIVADEVEDRLVGRPAATSEHQPGLLERRPHPGRDRVGAGCQR